MDRVPVTSSNLKSVGYDGSSLTLEVEFLNGQVYRYYSVPASVHEGLMGAGSKGSYFDQNVKTGEYAYRRIG